MSCGSINPRNPDEMTENELDVELERFLFRSNMKESTIEKKKERVKKNITNAQEKHIELAEYMQTDEYKNGISQFADMDPDEAYRYKPWGEIMGLYVEYTDDEKRALGVKGEAERKETQKLVEKYMPSNEFIPGTEYIFFSIEFGQFATRMILVPKKEFTEAYDDILVMLRKNAVTSHDENGNTVHELYTIYKKHENIPKCFSSLQNEFNTFKNGMQTFAECESHHGVVYGHLDDNHYEKYNKEYTIDFDAPWYTKSVCCGHRYFNTYVGWSVLSEEAIEQGCTTKEHFMFFDKHEDEEDDEYEAEGDCEYSDYEDCDDNLNS